MHRSPRNLYAATTFLLGLALAGTPPEARSQSAGCEEIRGELDRYLNAVPHVEDPALDQTLAGIMTRLLRGAGYPGLELDVLVLDSEQIGAFATACHQIILTRGILDWQGSLGEENASGPGADAVALSSAYTASVLGHELAHVTLGHTGELVERPLGLLGDLAGEAPRPTREMRLEGAAVREAWYSQEREFEADRVGALYLLRAGWEIQHAMDTFRGLDALARTDPEGCFYCLEATSYLSTHPRSSDREAAVESFRADLKRLQASFDDALTLIIHNTELDHAIGLLDEVLALFPGLLPAKHARAVALQTRWANGLSVQSLRVKMSLPVYAARFLTGIRGEPDLPNPGLLEAARKGYHEVLLHEQSPYSLSNLAVLDAYAGDSGPARRWATQAAELAPTDVQVLNNLGVVLYLTGDISGAAEIFERAAAAPGGEEYLSLAFNRGRALTELGEEAGHDLLVRYFREDPYSGWSREAMRLARVTPRGSPAAAEAPAPVVAGVELGASPEAVEAALGGRPPRGDQRLTGPVLAWNYADRGLRVYIHQATGVSSVVVTKPGVSKVLGVDVSEPVEAFREQAKRLDLVPRPAFSLSQDEPRWIVSPFSDWEVSVAARDGTIVSICVKQVPATEAGGT